MDRLRQTTSSTEEAFFRIEENAFHPRRVSFSHRSYYTIALIIETGKLYFADKWVMIDRPALVFGSPLMPYAWEATGNERGTGFHCLFNEAFLRPQGLPNAQKEPLLFLSYDKLQTVKELLQKMLQESLSDYPQKMDILRSYLHILMHEINKIQLDEHIETHQSASQRIVELFLNMLDSQFPLDSRRHPLTLTAPADYADRLAVHVNHLNRVVKQVTGKTTRDIIASRMVSEAVRLLKTSDQSIGEIAFSLGFEEPASFSSFVRKHTGISPMQHRKKKDGLI